MEFEIRLDYTVEDFDAYWRAFLQNRPGAGGRKQASPRMHRNAGLVFLILGALIWLLADPLLSLPELVVGGLLVYSGYILGQTPSRWAKRAWKQYQASGDRYSCRLTEDGVQTFGGRSNSSWTYDSLESLWEDGERFYLLTSKNAVFILRKNAFVRGAPEDFGEFMEKQMGKPAERIHGDGVSL